MEGSANAVEQRREVRIVRDEIDDHLAQLGAFGGAELRSDRLVDQLIERGLRGEPAGRDVGRERRQRIRGGGSRGGDPAGAGRAIGTLGTVGSTGSVGSIRTADAAGSSRTADAAGSTDAAHAVAILARIMRAGIGRTTARLRGIIRPPMRRLTVLLIGVFCAAAAVAACGPKSSTGPREVDLGAYPALRWVPADVTYVGIAQTVEGTMPAVRDFVEALGILGEFDVAEVDRELTTYLGINPIDASDLREAGVDVAAGAVFYSQGFSPTFVFRLAEPVRMQERIDNQRAKNASGAIGNSVRDGIDVYTSLADRDLHTHWAIDGNWMWVHFEIVDEHEADLAWFDASRAAKGAIAKDPDLAWARGQAERVQAGAPLVALARPAKLASIFARIVNEPDATACMALVAAPRAAVTAGVAGPVSEGHIVLDVGAAGAAGISSMTKPVPAGWAVARGDAPAAIEWNLDGVAFARWFAPCDNDPEQIVEATGLRTVRAFLTDFSPDDLSGHGAVAADLAHRRMIDEQLNNFTGRSLFEKKRTFGPRDGVRLDPPMIPAVDYILTDREALAAVGDGVLEKVVGDGATVASPTLALLDLQPPRLGDAAWDLFLKYVGGVYRDAARETMIRRLKRWKRGTIALALDGEHLHLHLRGQR
jgi:hypothetical protein